MAFDQQTYNDLYPFTSRTLDVGGASMHYLDEGAGSPVLMLHGNPSWSFYYRNLVQALAPRHRVIVPDHIGCGLSDKPEAYDYTLERRVADVEKLLESLSLEQPLDLVVHDWGGMIGMAWATRNPGRVRRIVVLNTGAFFLPRAKGLPVALKICRDSLLGTVLVRGANAFSVAASHVGCKRNPMDSRLRAAYQAPYDSWANRVATLRFVQDIPLVPGDRSYARVAEVEENLGALQHHPMLILWGEQDFVFDRHFLAEWRRRFPDAAVTTFPDGGHYILEDARAEVVPAIATFLDEAS